MPGGNSTTPPCRSTKHEAPSQQEAERWEGTSLVESGGAETRQQTSRRQQQGASLEFSIFTVFLHCFTIKRDPSPCFLASRIPLVRHPSILPPTFTRLVVTGAGPLIALSYYCSRTDQAQLYGTGLGKISNIPTPISPHSTTCSRFKPTISLQIAPKDKKARSDPTQIQLGTTRPSVLRQASTEVRYSQPTDKRPIPLAVYLPYTSASTVALCALH